MIKIMHPPLPWGTAPKRAQGAAPTGPTPPTKWVNSFPRDSIPSLPLPCSSAGKAGRLGVGSLVDCYSLHELLQPSGGKHSTAIKPPSS